MRAFNDLAENEVLALAISSEEEDGRIYADIAEGLRQDFPDSAAMFAEMAEEESGHRRALLDLYVQKFGSHIPLVRRADVNGYPQRKPVWQMRPLRIETMRKQAWQMEQEASRFYRAAAQRSTDVSIRKLLGDLAEAEAQHARTADDAEDRNLTGGKRESEDEVARRRFVLQVVQPGLVGLMDGSVSTLAPVFAAALATQSTWSTFLVGMAASIGAGISMGFAEALSDDGKISGRGTPLLRGIVCGLMTAVGGIGHTLPFLISNFRDALAVAIAVVIVELAVICWIRWRFMATPPLRAAAQIGLGGALVFGAGILIGSS